MDHVTQAQHGLFFWLFSATFIFFYPMLISIYVFLPLLIGAMGYMLVQGLEREKTLFILLSIVYMVNLEVNLSLPIFLTVISSLLFYVLLYPSLKHFRRCIICRALLSVLLLDLMYLGCLFTYDFIFQTQSIILDEILLYTLIVDMLVVVIL
ncbi:hypothetical protein MN086_06780 [Sulfurovum sp. XGS-02]|uniref:hypothetical protein n=1 Tax=Sulfurovum sp. XGS-02 TaxID=2925411 RepID=UPI002050427B|nr:hypothetical protein [Sulfurovum sp. XGS-02]UPT76756.1 hypothetical protein MN086_06780 [Sulfurovum sp. XGS-02]